MADRQQIENLIVEILRTRSLDHHGLRMALRDKQRSSVAPYIERHLRNLREKGLIRFAKNQWHIADVLPCAHCNGTGFVKKSTAATASSPVTETPVAEEEEEATDGQD